MRLFRHLVSAGQRESMARSAGTMNLSTVQFKLRMLRILNLLGVDGRVTPLMGGTNENPGAVAGVCSDGAGLKRVA